MNFVVLLDIVQRRGVTRSGPVRVDDAAEDRVECRAKCGPALELASLPAIRIFRLMGPA
jgi:hypothetical protein